MKQETKLLHASSLQSWKETKKKGLQRKSKIRGRRSQKGRHQEEYDDCKAGKGRPRFTHAPNVQETRIIKAK